MGDKLRSTIGIASNWESHEITNYKNKRRRELTSVYLGEKLRADNPASRARYLDARLEIEDGTAVEREILRIAREKGKSSALVFLEDLALEIF